METISMRSENDVLYLELNGRIDASNANAAEEKLNEFVKLHPGKTPVIDAEGLEYLSSAGLRVLLRFRKTLSSLRIINVHSEVYEILEMTGFTEIFQVEKAFRRLSLEGCELIASGASGRVYRYDDETIVKLFVHGTTPEEVRRERDLCRRVFIKGINTAIPYDVVRVGEYFGSVAELLNADSVSKLIRENTERMDEYISVYAELLKKIHATQVEEGEMPSFKKIGLEWAAFLKPHLPEHEFDKLWKMMNALSEPMSMLHGDYHVNNVMLQNGEAMLIDMDTVGCGHPIFDFAAMYLGYRAFPELDHEEAYEFYRLSYDTVGKIWKETLNRYFDGDRARMQDCENKAMLLAYARLLRRTILRDESNTAQIELCKNYISKLLGVVDELEF